VTGFIAGWASGVLQHAPFRRAPLSHVAAKLIVTVGRVFGKVPASAARGLLEQSFGEFCSFQVGAERTAVISWEYVAKLLAQDPKDAALAAATARIAEDEQKHEKVLALLVEAFDVEDRARDGYDADRIEAALGAIDPAFVATESGATTLARSALGVGGPVVVREDARAASADPLALRALLRTTLDAAGLPDVLRGKRTVVVKTSFMMAYDRRDPSPHVDLHLVEELARYLRAHGAEDVAYLEAANHYDRFFANRSVAEVARYLGFESPLYRVVDVGADQVPHEYRRGFGQDGVSRTWRDADLRVVFGKMRTNPSMLVHLSVATLESLGRRLDELLFVDRRADLESGLMMILDAFPPDFAVLDATHHVPDGLTGILGDPTPCHPGRIYAAKDALALDLVAARHMGIHELPQRSTLAVAIDWFDDPRPRTEVDGHDAPITTLLSPQRNDLTIFLSALAYPVYVMGGDKGNLWVPVMDPAAFPPNGRPTLLEWALRPTLRALFGFGRPPR
jgi:uncharacterized protein (DUF362 family)